MDLKTFLLARIEEDETVARAAVGKDGRWHVDQSHPLDESVVRGDIHIYDEGGHTAEQALHIATHDPARVLAECAAKRAIMDIHWDRDGDCARCSDYAWFAVLDGGEYEEFPCPTVRALAAVYADHPDYQPEWAQEAS